MDWNLVYSLLEYIRYPYNASLQFSVVSVTLSLTQRTKNLVQKMSCDAPMRLAQPRRVLATLIHSYATVFRDSLISTPMSNVSTILSATSLSYGKNEDYQKLISSDSDNSASLMLELLMTSLDQPYPSMAHLLLGFVPDLRIEAISPRKYLEFYLMSVVFEFLTNLRSP
jgi:hypothetical protein